MDFKKYFAGRGKKRELGQTSRNSDIQQSSIKFEWFTNVDDILAKEWSFPGFVTALLNCIKNLEKQVVNFLAKQRKLKTTPTGEHIFAEQHLIELNKTITFISKMFNKYEIKSLKRSIRNFEKINYISVW